MTLEFAKNLVDEINKTSLHFLRDDLLNYAVEYSRIRVDWYFTPDENKNEIENLRAAKHEAFIDSCNILSREMIKAGEDASWRQELGNNRKEIGDFACYIHCLLGIFSR